MQNAHDASQISAEKQLEMRLRDFLLDIEDRIYQGTLGAIKVFVNCKAPRSTVVPSSLWLKWELLRAVGFTDSVI